MRRGATKAEYAAASFVVALSVLAGMTVVRGLEWVWPTVPAPNVVSAEPELVVVTDATGKRVAELERK